MDEYLNKLYLEYKKATGFNSSLSDQKFFYMWLKERSSLVKKYAYFINRLGLEEKKVVEIDKGASDSTCETLNKLGCEAIAVTDYNKTFPIMVDAISNSVVIKNGLPFIKESLITTLLTQLPIEDKLLEQLKQLASNGTEIVLGTYGNSLDKDKNENIELLKLYESILYLMEDVSIKSKYVDNGITYMGAVISKPKIYLLDKYPLRKI